MCSFRDIAHYIAAVVVVVVAVGYDCDSYFWPALHIDMRPLL